MELGIKSEYSEKDSNFWQTEIDTLERKVGVLLDRLNNDQNKISHISLFALAPMPLLIKLGTLLSELYDVEVYHRFREPQGWAWHKSVNAIVENPFVVKVPITQNKQPVLILSISASIRERICKYYEMLTRDICNQVVHVVYIARGKVASHVECHEVRAYGCATPCILLWYTHVAIL